MIVQNVQGNIYSKNNKYLSGPINNTQNINFNGLGFLKRTDALLSDVYTSSLSKKDLAYKASLDNILQKIKTQTLAFTPEKLEQSIVNIKKFFPEISEETILLCMQRLTQWANYSAFEPLAKSLIKEDVCNINLNPNNDLLNKTLSYFIDSKGIIGLNRYTKYNASFITKQNYKLYQEQSKDVLFINLEGFEDGINFLSDDNELAKKTINLIIKAQKIMKDNPELDFEQAISYVFNNKISKFAESKNFSVTTLTRHNAPTRETILEQMSPYRPKTVNEIKNIIEAIVEQINPATEKKRINLRNNIAKYYEENIEIFSKQRLIESLKDINVQINEYLTVNKIDKDNVFYLIPRDKSAQIAKSFGLITEMYRRMYDIPEEKFFYQNNFLFASSIPKNSAVVILDDATISGESLIYTGAYDSTSLIIKDDIHILFSPLISYEDGFKELQKTINKKKRTNIDKIITVHKFENDKKFNLKKFLLKLYFTKTPTGRSAFGYRDGETKLNKKFLILPYMTPDNNSRLSTFLSRYFFPSNDNKRFYAVKNTHLYCEDVHKKVINKNNKSC